VIRVHRPPEIDDSKQHRKQKNDNEALFDEIAAAFPSPGTMLAPAKPLVAMDSAGH
jgi:hypothetical protein